MAAALISWARPDQSLLQLRAYCCLKLPVLKGARVEVLHLLSASKFFTALLGGKAIIICDFVQGLQMQVSFQLLREQRLPVHLFFH